jgi:hypothetical protein
LGGESGEERQDLVKIHSLLSPANTHPEALSQWIQRAAPSNPEPAQDEYSAQSFSWMALWFVSLHHHITTCLVDAPASQE